MRKLLTLVLLAIFVLPLFAPVLALAATGGTMVAACCRRTGQHHCAESMATMGSSAGSRPAFRAPEQMCPFRSAWTCAQSHHTPALPAAEASYAGVVSHPAVHVQTECLWRIARDRSRQKRGPPAPSLL